MQVKRIGLLAAAVAAIGLAPLAQAAVISVNFSAAPSTTDFGLTSWPGGFDAEKTRITGSEMAGVVSVGNWNNTDEASGTTLPDLKDDSGVATTADLVLPTTQYHQGNGFKSAAPSNVIDELYTAMGGRIFNAGLTYTLTVEQVPYSLYDVYVYVARTDDNGPTQSADFTLTPDGGLGITESVAPLEGASGAFDDATADGDGNYIKYTGLTAASFDLLVDSTDGKASTVAGFQIVQVPEPASLALMGLGGLLMLPRRRSA